MGLFLAGKIKLCRQHLVTSLVCFDYFELYMWLRSLAERCLGPPLSLVHLTDLARGGAGVQVYPSPRAKIPSKVAQFVDLTSYCYTHYGYKCTRNMPFADEKTLKFSRGGSLTPPVPHVTHCSFSFLFRDPEVFGLTSR